MRTHKQSLKIVGITLLLFAISFLLISFIISMNDQGRFRPLVERESLSEKERIELLESFDSAMLIKVPGIRIFLTPTDVAIAALVISAIGVVTSTFFSWKNERRSKVEADLRMQKLELEIQELREKQKQETSLRRKKRF